MEEDFAELTQDDLVHFDEETQTQRTTNLQETQDITYSQLDAANVLDLMENGIPTEHSQDQEQDNEITSSQADTLDVLALMDRGIPESLLNPDPSTQDDVSASEGEEDEDDEEEEPEQTEEDKESKKIRRMKLLKAMGYITSKTSKRSNHEYLEEECEEGEEDEEGNFIRTEVLDDDEANINEEQMLAEMGDFLALEEDDIEHIKAPIVEEDDYGNISDDEESDDEVVILSDDEDGQTQSLRQQHKRQNQSSPTLNIKKRVVDPEAQKKIMETNKLLNYSIFSKRAALNISKIQSLSDNNSKTFQANHQEKENLLFNDPDQKKMESKMIQRYKEIQQKRRAEKKKRLQDSSEDAQSSLVLLSSQESLSPVFSSSFQTSDWTTAIKNNAPVRGSFLKTAKKCNPDQIERLAKMKAMQKCISGNVPNSSGKSSLFSFNKPKSKAVAASKKTASNKSVVGTKRKKARKSTSEDGPAKKKKTNV
ncbi:hypothetical protein AKO1_014446 [Acrasis kona]|uniref:Uncharacterized protein n=1 Tax=Acrasis kona TaxID=1008807 RepID=A0AAW2Z0R6_9EUKA